MSKETSADGSTSNPAESSSRPSSSSSSTPSPRSQRSPYPPSPLEAALLAIYPGTLLLGSLFSLLNPSAHAAPYSALTQSHPPDLAPSYFARKRNIFNVFFVKIGWFWTTLAFAIFLFTHPSTGPTLSPVLTPRRIRGVLRWCAVTACWAAVTQWFFGPALIDRGFRITGGACELIRDESSRAQMSDTKEFVTAATCKLAGGQWKGGHDISGHVFMLVLGSAFLWMEVLPVVMTRARGLREEKMVRFTNGEVGSAMVEAEVESQGNSSRSGAPVAFGVKAVLLVAGLSWWMLLMTAAYFHTWFEKFTGLFVAFTAIFTVYLLPRGLPALRAILGMPGV
ncbi:MAG: hypothetical protein M1819_006177 [Sarea resinae]|nr:MAG: hypothetical protein M1819_006177 [Sarea resinae]